LRPALVDGSQAPLCTRPQGTQRFPADYDEDGIRVRGWQDAGSDPTTPLNGNVELQVTRLSVRNDRLSRNWLSIHDDFNWHLPRITDTGTLDMPIGLFRVRPPLDCTRRRLKKFVIPRIRLRGGPAGRLVSRLVVRNNSEHWVEICSNLERDVGVATCR